MNKVKIVSDNNLRTKVFLDEQELHFIQSISFNHKVDTFPTVTIELGTDDVEVCLERAEIIKKDV